MLDLEAMTPLLLKGGKVFPLSRNNTPTQKEKDRSPTDSPPEAWASAGVHLEDVIVLDIDIKNGKAGFESAAKLQQEHGKFPETFTVRTKSGGQHLYFRGVGGCRVGVKDGIDIRGVGGYVVAPGSPGYEVIQDSEIAPAPLWLMAMAGQPSEPGSKGPKTPVCELDKPENIRNASYYAEKYPICHPGTRNAEYFKLAAMIKDMGVSRDRVFEIIRDHYSPRMPSPLPISELEAVCASAFQYGKEAPGVLAMQNVFSDNQEIESLPLNRWSQVDLSDLPGRQWIIKGRYAKGFVSALLSPGGVGKTTVALAEGLAVATGALDCGAEVKEHGATWFHVSEDPNHELYQRMLAFCQYYDIDRRHMPHEILLTTDMDFNVKLMKQTKTDTFVDVAFIERMKATILREDIKLVFLDPFVELHELNENDNRALSQLMKLLRDVARECHCAIVIIHHCKKMGKVDYSGDMDAGRGASSVVNACRSVYTASCMTEEECERFGIDPAASREYVKLACAKNNMASFGKHIWYHRKVVMIGEDEWSIVQRVDEDFEGHSGELFDARRKEILRLGVGKHGNGICKKMLGFDPTRAVGTGYEMEGYRVENQGGSIVVQKVDIQDLI